jgi:hypothetical protein
MSSTGQLIFKLDGMGGLVRGMAGLVRGMGGLVGSAPACYGSALGSNPGIPQKS